LENLEEIRKEKENNKKKKKEIGIFVPTFIKIIFNYLITIKLLGKSIIIQVKIFSMGTKS